LLALLLTTSLAACEEKRPTSLVGEFAVPGAYALAGDTITVWRRDSRPGGGSRLLAYSITPGGSVEAVDEAERLGSAGGPVEEAQAGGPEQRRSFILPPQDFEAIRAAAARLRPAAMGPEDPVGGYVGQVSPRGCRQVDGQPGTAGINFLNAASWGTFVLQPGCSGEPAAAATVAMADIFARLDRASAGAPAARR
jgi:hypothetical protein